MDCRLYLNKKEFIMKELNVLLDTHENFGNYGANNSKQYTSKFALNGFYKTILVQLTAYDRAFWNQTVHAQGVSKKEARM